MSQLSKSKLCLVDVGGAGGIKDEWLPFADQIAPVLFEPNPAEAAKLRDQLRSGVVIEKGLSNKVETRTLNITNDWGCTSMLQPNEETLRPYRIAPLFGVAKTLAVECTRYDLLHQAGEAPVPDAIKIDVQGFEYQVLLGFGGLLESCLGIELEAHVYPLYRDQRLLGDLIKFLADFGLVLRRIMPVHSFDGDVVELDAWFTPGIERWRSFSDEQRGKYDLICRVWGLVNYRRINPRAPHPHIDPD